jgi:hypothetical protein
VGGGANGGSRVLGQSHLFSRGTSNALLGKVSIMLLIGRVIQRDCSKSQIVTAVGLEPSPTYVESRALVAHSVRAAKNKLYTS